jgi:hypothetical protein
MTLSLEECTVSSNIPKKTHIEGTWSQSECYVLLLLLLLLLLVSGGGVAVECMLHQSAVQKVYKKKDMILPIS